MESLQLLALRQVLWLIDDTSNGFPNDELEFLTRLSTSKQFAKRRFGLYVSLPKYQDCEYETEDAIYPATLKEIVENHNSIKLGFRVKFQAKPLLPESRNLNFVWGTIRYVPNLDCECYSCQRMK